MGWSEDGKDGKHAVTEVFFECVWGLSNGQVLDSVFMRWIVLWWLHYWVIELLGSVSLGETRHVERLGVFVGRRHTGDIEVLFRTDLGNISDWFVVFIIYLLRWSVQLKHITGNSEEVFHCLWQTNTFCRIVWKVNLVQIDNWACVFRGCSPRRAKGARRIHFILNVQRQKSVEIKSEKITTKYRNIFFIAIL